MIESKNSDESLPTIEPVPAQMRLGLIRSVSGEALSEIAQILHAHSKANLESVEPAKGAQKRVNNGKVYGAYSREGELMGFICGTKWGRLGILGPLAVALKHQGKGISTQLISRMVSWLSSDNNLGAACMTIAASIPESTMSCVRLFQSLGFEKSGHVTAMRKQLDCEESKRTLPGFYQLTKNCSPEFLSSLVSRMQLKLPGADVTSEMLCTLEQGLGAVLYIADPYRAMLPVAFAIVHHGKNACVSPGAAHVKFLFAENETSFNHMLVGLENYARKHCLLQAEVAIHASNIRARTVMHRLNYEACATTACMMRVDSSVVNSFAQGLPIDGEDLFVCADFRCTV